MAAEIISSEQLFEGRVFRVRRDQVRFDDGRETVYDLVKHNGSVTLIPLDGDDNLWFVQQYRHPVAATVLEFPAGTLEKDEAPEACARRECREEIGMDPGELTELSTILLAPGYSSERSHLFLATELEPAPLDGDEEEDIKVYKVPLADVHDMIAAGEIRDAKTLVGLLLALPILDP